MILTRARVCGGYLHRGVGSNLTGPTTKYACPTTLTSLTSACAPIKALGLIREQLGRKPIQHAGLKDQGF